MKSKAKYVQPMNIKQLLHTQTKQKSSSVIRQKGESQNGCFKKAKHAKISEKQAFLTP